MTSFGVVNWRNFPFLKKILNKSRNGNLLFEIFFFILHQTLLNWDQTSTTHHFAFDFLSRLWRDVFILSRHSFLSSLMQTLVFQLCKSCLANYRRNVCLMMSGFDKDASMRGKLMEHFFFLLKVKFVDTSFLSRLFL